MNNTPAAMRSTHPVISNDRTSVRVSNTMSAEVQIRPRLITFATDARRVQEHRLAFGQPRQRDADDIAGLGQTRFCVADRPAALGALGCEPAVELREVLAAMVDLGVLDPHSFTAYVDR